MKNIIICLMISAVSFAQQIKTGAENSAKYLPLLKGKTVGIVTNQTGIITKEKHLVDFLVEQKVKIKS
ncbi:MAG TPA: DUF1343 domain-containing protein, partial [Flavobacterium sp.]|nr:DUF1343 domain-containing protein [Flavobacterium sp.]